MPAKKNKTPKSKDNDNEEIPLEEQVLARLKTTGEESDEVESGKEEDEEDSSKEESTNFATFKVSHTLAGISVICC